MLRCVCACLLLLYSSSALSEQAERYSIEQLRGLYAQRAWLDLVQHLTDVRPAQRDGAWREMLEAAADGYLGDLAELGSVDYPQFLNEIEQLEHSYPLLDSSPEYARKRDDLLVKKFAVCIRSTPERAECIAAMYTRLENPRANARTAFTAGEALVINKLSAPAVLFFHLALLRAERPYACAGKYTTDAVFAALHENSVSHEASAGREIASGPCWNTLKDRLQAELSAAPTPSADFRVNVCAVLRAKEAVPPKAQKRCG